MLLNGWRASWSIFRLRRCPAASTRLPTTIMSFSTARIVQEVRVKYKSDELEAKKHQEQKVIDNNKKKKKKNEKAVDVKVKAKKSTVKAKQTKVEVDNRDNVVSDSEPERIAEEHEEAQQHEQKNGLATASSEEPLNSRTTSVGSILVSEHHVELASPKDDLPAGGSPDIEIVKAELDVEYVGAQKLNLDQYRYTKLGRTSGTASPAMAIDTAAARAVTSRSDLADQASRSKSGMPSPGSMDKFLKTVIPQQPEASTSTRSSAETGTEHVEESVQGKKTMSRGNGTVKKEKVKKEKVELPDYPVSEILMKELDGCVVCGVKWEPRRMLKTKWVRRVSSIRSHKRV